MEHEAVLTEQPATPTNLSGRGLRKYEAFLGTPLRGASLRFSSVAPFGRGLGFLPEVEVAVRAAGGGGVGVERGPVEEVARAEVKAAPHHDRRAFPGVVDGPEPRAGVGLAVLVDAARDATAELHQSTMSVASTASSSLTMLGRLAKMNSSRPLRDATGSPRSRAG